MSEKACGARRGGAGEGWRSGKSWRSPRLLRRGVGEGRPEALPAAEGPYAQQWCSEGLPGVPLPSQRGHFPGFVSAAGMGGSGGAASPRKLALRVPPSPLKESK